MSISRCDLLTRFRKLHAGETAWCSVILDSGLVLYPIKKLDCCWRPEGCPRRNAASWKIYAIPRGCAGGTWAQEFMLLEEVRAPIASAGAHCQRHQSTGHPQHSNHIQLPQQEGDSHAFTQH